MRGTGCRVGRVRGAGCRVPDGGCGRVWLSYLLDTIAVVDVDIDVKDARMDLRRPAVTWGEAEAGREEQERGMGGRSQQGRS